MISVALPSIQTTPVLLSKSSGIRRAGGPSLRCLCRNWLCRDHPPRADRRPPAAGSAPRSAAGLGHHALDAAGQCRDGAGKEDFALGRAHGLPVLAPLDDDGVYVAGYGWLSGRKAADVAEHVAAELERKGLLLDREQYTHRYPVCWRCGTELVFRLTDEWSISMDELRHQMMDSTRAAIRWRSKHFWMISRTGMCGARAGASGDLRSPSRQ